MSRVVLITGATGGLGPSVVRAFVNLGDRVALTDRSLEKAQKFMSEEGYTEEQVFPFGADVTQAQSLTSWVQAVREKWGQPQVLITLVGGFKAGTPLHELEEKDWDQMMNLNARSVFLAARAVVPHMLEAGAGKIITVGAKAGLSAGKGAAAYSASKAAVLRLTESLSLELKDRGINVNAVIPSTIDTPANREGMPHADHSKWVTPEDLASVIVFLASDAARAVHGALIPVYGRA
ncbi:SDR family oxidoreductase [Deinococcus cellulosilyticus]|uniref:Short-chain dehydrogenase n=1 Tax=Deinococcus cellulosilyticus (strain DSM 18568 / NBRC 106333 / KACC 11606 / 5516J-15) TaxID=1223518 RepID=A0A511MW05_DEIC1|nr:SDR family NAD(P)-dependent oxidoreductase [Deinococcus cellulosilyticus]GEM44448.1 short-chain dehydrogenase [Deinococcus cellulosilyticus NBRC 106333 = KACC 11606]